MDATRFQHTPFYCEENVYLLCKTLCENGVADATGSDLFVIFISNEKKQANMFLLFICNFVCLVLFRVGIASPAHCFSRFWLLILEFQLFGCARLVIGVCMFPCPLSIMLIRCSCRFHFGIRKLVAELMGLYCGIIMSSVYRFFRIVHALLFFKYFASDRRHMKEPDGSWTAQPPPYQPIVAQDGILHNLSEYIAMSGADTLSSLDPETVRAAISQKLGVLVSHTQLQDLFTKLP